MHGEPCITEKLCQRALRALIFSNTRSECIKYLKPQHPRNYQNKLVWPYIVLVGKPIMGEQCSRMFNEMPLYGNTPI